MYLLVFNKKIYTHKRFHFSLPKYVFRIRIHFDLIRIHFNMIRIHINMIRIGTVVDLPGACLYVVLEDGSARHREQRLWYGG